MDEALKPAAEPAKEWPADQSEHRLVSELTPYARNARTHSDAQINQIAASITEWGWTVPVVIDETGMIIAGHARVLAAERLGLAEVPVVVARGWTDEQKRAYVIADNKLPLNAGWDDALLQLELSDLQTSGFDLSLIGFNVDELRSMWGGEEAAPTASLSERFGVPPFSVLNAREGWWQARKAAWLALGIESELGRGGGITWDESGDLSGFRHGGIMHSRDRAAPGGSLMPTIDKATGKIVRADSHGRPIPGTEAGWRRKANAEPAGGGGGGWAEMNRQMAANRAKRLAAARAPGEIPGGMTFGAMTMSDGAERTITGTSIFDPVLCELAYRWFCPPDGLVLDPFAGGSVRGIVAARLGRAYLGVDLSERQIEANRAQAKAILRSEEPQPAWRQGDSREIAKHAEGVEADFVFSCPPYADLERYSDDPADLSTLPYAEFQKALALIVEATCRFLKPDRFAAFVVGDARGPDGNYYGLPWDMVAAVEAAGLKLYNEAVLVTAAGSLPIRAAKQFEVSRKLGKTHQNVLVFVKGNPRAAALAIGAVEFGEIGEDAEAGEEPLGGEIA